MPDTKFSILRDSNFNKKRIVIPPVAGTFGPSGKMLDDDYGGVAGPDDEPTMPNGAQGSGRRPGASRRDGRIFILPTYTVL